ncbi:M24 family metallopeptidase [Paenibacillus allorhizosphaerae]|uniref:M24 family metallopeptidase n=1 Tax=Paenibacillus allorhizosphaerae TaxID=2849866 RepID=A0ABM8VAE1_9BACL|nr:M24 family metallopeptidase [Paenibacillus allorhizosphaerae]CAG7616089.1 hypothetical protein PAECIP111802_00246 [Paenibacillus allorhizosphaerae]
MERDASNVRLQKLKELAAAEKAAILITQQKNLSWLLGGRCHVNIASEPGCCQYLVTNDKNVLFVNNIEAKRLEEEEVRSDLWEQTDAVEVWDWFNPGSREQKLRTHIAGRAPLKTDVELEAVFMELRSVLDDDRIEDFKQLGRLTAEATEKAAFDVKPGDTEFAIAGRLAYRCYERGLDPIVNLIAADERIFQRRHPLPTGKTLQSYAMLVVCARRNGLIASATRLVHFGAVPEPISDKMRAVAEIDARMIDATTEGKPLGAVYSEAMRFYSEAGYPDEYRYHHQGGLTGYATREKLATPHEKMTIRRGQIFAWNPSIAGVKSEDTIYVGANGSEIVTPTLEYPGIEIHVNGKTYVRPGILQR